MYMMTNRRTQFFGRQIYAMCIQTPYIYTQKPKIFDIRTIDKTM